MVNVQVFGLTITHDPPWHLILTNKLISLNTVAPWEPVISESVDIGVKREKLFLYEQRRLIWISDANGEDWHSAQL